VTVEKPVTVHAAMAGVRIGHYSRRVRKSTSGGSFPGVRSGAGWPARPRHRRRQSAESWTKVLSVVRLHSDTTY